MSSLSADPLAPVPWPALLVRDGQHPDRLIEFDEEHVEGEPRQHGVPNFKATVHSSRERERTRVELDALEQGVQLIGELLTEARGAAS